MNELTNTVKLSGQVVEEPVFNHEAFSEKFYKTTIKVFRKSGIADFVPVVISQVLFDANRNWKDAYVNVSGQIMVWWNIERSDKMPKCEMKIEQNGKITLIILEFDNVEKAITAKKVIK